MDRVSMLRGFIEKSPTDPFPRYALALELKNTGRLAEALGVFQDLVAAVPDYVAAYLHFGNALVEAGHKSRARAVYLEGVEAAARKGDGHAAGELQGALAALGA